MIALNDEEVKKVYQLVEEKYQKANNLARFKHILGVVKAATSLAIKYNVSVKKAQIAALMHDYFHNDDKKIMQAYLTEVEIKECESCKALYHGYASASYYLKNVGQDKEIARAIKYHTFGKLPLTRLEEIILISDYIEENRTYKDCVYCRNLVQKGLFYTAIYESTLNTIKHLKSQDIEPHIYQYQVLKHYKEVMQMELLEIVKEVLGKVKATNIACYETREVSPFYDYIVLATVSTARQSNAIGEYLEEQIENTPYKIRGEEGINSNWYLIDLGSIIISVLSSEERERLDLDSLYSNLNTVEI